MYICAGLSAIKAQSLVAYPNACSSGLGHITSVVSGFTNPAFSSFESSRSLELNYMDRFSLRELSTVSAELHYPNSFLEGGLYLSRYGFSAYNETKVAVNLSHRLAEKWALGIRIQYTNLHYSEEYTDKGVLTADIGMWVEAMEDRLRFAFVLCNPLQSSIRAGEDEKEELLPVLFLIGISYYLNQQFLVLAEVEKENDTSMRCRIGAEYHPFPVLSLRGGLQTSPFSPTLGIGFHWKWLDVNAGFSRHEKLGIESACGLRFLF